MAVFQSLEQARAHFEQERFAVVSGMVIDEIGEDWSRVSVELTEMHRSADGGITGGVIFTLADFACAAAMNQIHLPSVAQQVSISYLSAPRGKKLFACARCRKNGRTSAVLDVDVTDDTGRDIAQAAAIGFKLDARPADIQKQEEINMATFQNLEDARKHFAGDRFAAASGMKIDEIGEDWSRVSMELTEMHRNANGGVMGGVIFTLADFAFAVAINQVHLPSVAQQVSINYLSAPRGKKLFAHAACRKNGRTSAVFNVDVTDDTGRDIAQFIGTGFKLSARPASDRKDQEG